MELLEIRNKIQSENLELIKYKQSQSQFVRSPVDGVITNIFYKQGQVVEASKILLHIIPDNSTLVARLYIPSKDIGFLKKELKSSLNMMPTHPNDSVFIKHSLGKLI